MRFCERCRAAFQSRSTCPRDRVPTRSDISDPLLGAIVGDRYRILDRIAAGGMGQVYRASHVRIASLYAIKVLYGDLAYDPGMRARFQREAEATSLLSHRHIVRVFDFGETPEGLLYITMEHVDGASLSALVAREGHLSEDRTVYYARQIARGLAHAHERGIVHRDLKTENILVAREDDEEDSAKILDFGLAQMRTEARLTQAGQVFGTPLYMAPEQFLSTEVDSRADLYSFGVVLYEMLTGGLPFDAPSVSELSRLHLTAPPEPLRGIVPDISPELEAVVLRLMAKAPNDRFPSARAVLDALRGCARPRTAPVSSAPRSVPVASAQSLAAVPPSVRGPIEATIVRGAPAYNAGDHAGCAALYQQTGRSLLERELSAGPLAARARLRAALERAGRALSPSAAAWEIRYAFDDLLGATQKERPAEGAGGFVGVEVALAEIIGAPRFASGHLDIVGDYYIALAQELAAVIRASDPTSAAADYLDRAARTGVARGGGQRALAYVHEALVALSQGASKTLVSGPPSSSAGLESAPTALAGSALLDAVVQRIAQALATGVPAYNAGDPATCARVYRQAAEGLVTDLSSDPSAASLVARLNSALADARTRDPDGAAWALRRVFDELLAIAASRPAR